LNEAMTARIPKSFPLLLASFLFFGCAGPTPEARWAREERKLVRYEGPTSEPSSGGAGLAVYLNSAGQVRHLDWTLETSRQLINRKYYFEEGSSPSWVIETTYATMDPRGGYLARTHLLSRTQHHLVGRGTNARAPEFLEHSRLLIQDFKAHRKDYVASGPVKRG
jgi:hypothetical protein